MIADGIWQIGYGDAGQMGPVSKIGIFGHDERFIKSVQLLKLLTPYGKIAGGKIVKRRLERLWTRILKTYIIEHLLKRGSECFRPGQLSTEENCFRKILARI